MATPILKQLNVDDGSFYQFSEAAKHLEATTTIGNLKFVPSKFVCLKLPKYEQNAIKNTLFDLRPTAEPNPNVGLPRFLQNYVENLTQHLIASNQYDGFASVLEMAIWKWLGAMGALHVKDSSEAGFYDEGTNSTVASFEYENIIQYVGNCEIQGWKQYLNTDYTEIYMNIPANAGKSQNVRFKTTDHPLWLGQNTITPDTYSFGLDAATNAPLGALSITDDNGVYDLTLNDIGTLTGGTNHQICKTNGLQLDFDSVIAGDENFDFNCVLLYYDHFDYTNQTEYGRNLYGMLFLDDFEEDGGVWSMPDTKKYSSAESVTANSFEIIINRHLNSSTLNASPKFSINVYNSASMQNYTEALERLMALARLYENLSNQIGLMTQKIANFEHQYAQIQTNLTLLERVTVIEQTLAGFGGSETNQIKNDDLLKLFLDILNNVQQNGGNISGNFDFVFNNPLPPTAGNEGKVLHAGANDTSYWADAGRSATLYRIWFDALLFQVSTQYYVIGNGNNGIVFEANTYFGSINEGTVEDVAKALDSFLVDFNNSGIPFSSQIDANLVFDGSYTEVTQEDTLIECFTRLVTEANNNVYAALPLDLAKIIVR